MTNEGQYPAHADRRVLYEMSRKESGAEETNKLTKLSTTKTGVKGLGQPEMQDQVYVDSNQIHVGTKRKRVTSTSLDAGDEVQPMNKRIKCLSNSSAYLACPTSKISTTSKLRKVESSGSKKRSRERFRR